MFFIIPILLLFGISIQAASDCKPWRWDADGRPLRGNWNQEKAVAEDNDDGPNEPPARLKPGDVNCREGFSAHDPVTPDSCASLARFGGISLKKFFILNPTLKEDCSNIIADTQYCIGGCRWKKKRPIHFLYYTNGIIFRFGAPASLGWQMRPS